MAPFNSASRIHDIFHEAMRHQEGEHLIQVWSAVFGQMSDGEQDAKQIGHVALMLTYAHDQLEDLLIQLRSTKFSEQIYGPKIQEFRNALIMHNINAAWKERRNSLTGDTLNWLRIFSEMIADEGSPLDAAELSFFREKLEALRADVLSVDFPAEVKLFFIKQIDVLIKAIWAYKVRGSVAFQVTAFEAAANLAANKEIFEQHKQDPNFAQVWEVIKGMWDWLNEKDVLTKVLTAYDLYQLLQGMQGLLPPGS